MIEVHGFFVATCFQTNYRGQGPLLQVRRLTVANAGADLVLDRSRKGSAVVPGKF